MNSRLPSAKKKLGEMTRSLLGFVCETPSGVGVLLGYPVIAYYLTEFYGAEQAAVIGAVVLAAFVRDAHHTDKSVSALGAITRGATPATIYASGIAYSLQGVRVASYVYVAGFGLMLLSGLIRHFALSWRYGSSSIPFKIDWEILKSNWVSGLTEPDDLETAIAESIVGVLFTGLGIFSLLTSFAGLKMPLFESFPLIFIAGLFGVTFLYIGSQSVFAPLVFLKNRRSREVAE